jgi:hypothetical protein
MISLETHPNHHSHLPLPPGRRHCSGLYPPSADLICPSVFALRATPRHAADSRYVMGSPCDLLTRLSVYCCLPIFVFPAPCGVGLDGDRDAMTHRRRGFARPVLPDNPVIFSAVPTFETQRASRDKHRLLSVRRRRIRYTWFGHDEYRALPCVAFRKENRWIKY